MTTLNLSKQDIDYISRVVHTEVPSYLRKRNPSQYSKMVKAVTDTVTNRMASDRFPTSAADVLNQRRQFSKITGPKSLSPHGSVQKTPRAPSYVNDIVQGHISDRVAGAPSVVGNSLHYANPNYSDRSNIDSWINPMIKGGAEKFGVGKAIHYHGNAPGYSGAPDYQINAQGVESKPSPFEVASLPSSRLPIPEARFDRGGTLEPKQSNPFALVTPAAAGTIGDDEYSAMMAKAYAPEAAAIEQPKDFMGPMPAPPLQAEFAGPPMPPEQLTVETPPAPAPVLPVNAAQISPPTLSQEQLLSSYPPAPLSAQTTPSFPAAPSLPAPPPTSSGSDVWRGDSDYGVANGGYELFRQNDGDVMRYSPKYDRTTLVSPDGSYKGSFDGRVEVEPESSMPSLSGVDGSMLNNMGGLRPVARMRSAAQGAALAGIPGAVIGALVGPYLKDKASGLARNILQDVTGPTSFPTAPRAPIDQMSEAQRLANIDRHQSGGGGLSNRTYDAIRSGRGGLF